MSRESTVSAASWRALLGSGLHGASRSAALALTALLLTALLLTALLAVLAFWLELGVLSLPYATAGAVLVLLSLLCVWRLVVALLAALAGRDAALHAMERTATLGRVGIFEHDLVTDRLSVNDVFRQMWGFPRADYPEVTLMDMLSRVPPHNLMQVERWIRESEHTAATEAEIVLPDGTRRWLQMNLVADHVGGYGTINRGAVFDVSELRSSQMALEAANRQLQQSSMTDELTGLFNRRYVREQLADPERRKPAHTHEAAVILVDVDHFKRINDQFGHDFGDVVLAGVSEVLRENVRDTDTVARWGGEEFLVVLPGALGDTGQMLAEKLRERIAARVFQHNAEQISITASLGVAYMNWHKTRLSQALIVADSNLYEAKRSGRNRVIAEQF